MKSLTKIERAWVMYDWADSVYSTIMLAAVFPVFFVGIAGGDGTPGSMWWGIGNSVANLLVGLLAPLLGALGQFASYKKRLWLMFLLLGVVFTFGAAFMATWQLLLFFYVVSRIGHAGAFKVYDMFLPDVTTKERMDRVSAMGYAMGYIGGSTIPFVASIALILFGDQVGIDTVLATRISIIITAVWWAIFSVPMWRHVHNPHAQLLPPGGKLALYKTTWRHTLATGQKIWREPAMRYFIVAYFLYIDGVGTVIAMATAFGAEIGLSTNDMIVALFLTQLIAFPFSSWAAKLSDRIGSIKTIIVAIMIYFVICVVGFLMGFGIEEAWFGLDTATLLFFVLAALVGTVQGGIQAISRSTFGKLVPPEKAGSYFGFFEIFGRFATVIGPGMYALVLGISGRASFAILSVVSVFFAGLIIMLKGRRVIEAQYYAEAPH